MHLIDGTAEDVAENYRIVRTELDKYGDVLQDKTEIVALNKCDALLDEEIEEKKAALEEASGRTVHMISGVAQMGVDDLMNILFDEVAKAREAEEDVVEYEEYEIDEEYEP